MLCGSWRELVDPIRVPYVSLVHTVKSRSELVRHVSYKVRCKMSDCAMLRYKMLDGAMTVDYRVQRVSCK